MKYITTRVVAPWQPEDDFWPLADSSSRQRAVIIFCRRNDRHWPVICTAPVGRGSLWRVVWFTNGRHWRHIGDRPCRHVIAVCQTNVCWRPAQWTACRYHWHVVWLIKHILRQSARHCKQRLISLIVAIGYWYTILLIRCITSSKFQQTNTRRETIVGWRLVESDNHIIIIIIIF